MATPQSELTVIVKAKDLCSFILTVTERQCSEGHEWKTTVASRTGPKKCGCRQCWYSFARTGRSKRKKITKKFDGI